MDIKVILITSYYRSKNSARNKEIDLCICNNINNTQIDLVFLLMDRKYQVIPEYLKDPKIRIFYTNGRQKYSDAFNIFSIARQEFGIEYDIISIVCNSDIYFVEYDIKKIKNTISSNTFLALSRWDILENGESKLHEASDSQDAWVFLNKIKEGFYEYYFGIPGCDNRIAHELIQVGYNVLNPSRSIQSFHLHLTNYRNYDDETPKIQPPYGYIKPY